MCFLRISQAKLRLKNVFQDRPEVSLKYMSESVARKCGVSVGHKTKQKTASILSFVHCIKHLPPLHSLKLFLSSQLSNIHLSFPLFPFFVSFQPTTWEY